VGLENFLCINFEQTMGMLPISLKLVEWFELVPEKITVLTNTRCNWRRLPSSREIGRSSIRGGQPFSVARKLRVGHFLNFQKEAPGIYRLVIFDYTYFEVMTRYLDHGDATRLVVEEEEV
jgi:hypothetical protein